MNSIDKTIILCVDDIFPILREEDWGEKSYSLRLGFFISIIWKRDFALSLVNSQESDLKMKTNTDKQCEKDEDKSLSKDGNCLRVNSVRRLQLKESNKNSLMKSHVFNLIICTKKWNTSAEEKGVGWQDVKQERRSLVISSFWRLAEMMSSFSYKPLYTIDEMQM